MVLTEDDMRVSDLSIRKLTSNRTSDIAYMDHFKPNFFFLY